MMRAAIFSEHGGVDKISIGEFPDPECGPDDAVIKVNAVSLNGFDPMILTGIPGLRTPMPMVPGGDYAGEIVELGANVGGGWAVGDRVCPQPFVPRERPLSRSAMTTPRSTVPWARNASANESSVVL